MMRALYSAVSGLQAHQTMMDVVGNNIANVNTIGFKKGQVTFQNMLSQTIRGAQSAAGSSGTTGTTGTSGVGGINAQQIGTGVMVGAINNIQTQGAGQSTGNSTDLMIQGDGYFTLTDGTNTYYTRAGAFSLDKAGNLVDSANGMKVCNETGKALDAITGSNIAIGTDGTISSGSSATSPGKVGLATFTNPEGLIKVGENMYITSTNSGDPTYTTPGSKSGTLVAGSLEMSNVDLASEFTNMIVAQRGYEANAKTIQAADEMLQKLVNLKQ